MNQPLIEQLAEGSELHTYDPGEIIVHQGDRAKAFYILVSGTVEILKLTDEGIERVMPSLTAPAYFGEIGLLEEGRRTATVRAAEAMPAEVIVISKALFHDFVRASELAAGEIAAKMQQYRIRDSLATAFESASQERLSVLAREAEVATYSQGDIIIRQGDTADYFYILTQGRVEVLHQRADGQTYLINFHEPGEFFGEIGLLQDRPRSATVRAADETVEVLTLSFDALRDLLGDSTGSEITIVQEMTKRLAQMAEG